MSIWRRAAIAVVACLLPLGAAEAKKDQHTAVADQLKADTETGSPFQKGLQGKIKERKNGHKKFVEDVTYETPVVEEIPDGTGYGPGNCPNAPTEEFAKKRCPIKGYVVKVSAKTTVKFAGPDQVHEPGPDQIKSKWPAIKMRKQQLAPDGSNVPVAGYPDDPSSYDDYTEQWHQKVQADVGDKQLDADGNPIVVRIWKDPAHPELGGVWDLDEEPREQEITEEITFTFPQGQDQAKAFFRRLARAAQAQGAPVTLQQAVLMGFTYSGPNIDYTIGDKKRVCLFGACATLWDIRAGFALDWALGLRLPGVASLTGPAEMISGQTYPFTSTFAPADWAAPDFSGVGAAAENGNEFVMRLEFFAGAKVKILGADVCPYCQYVEFSQDYGKTFATPFGPSAFFPIDPLRFEVKRWDYGIVAFGIGLVITPELGSDKVTAVANGAELWHSAPGAGVDFPVKACIQGGSHAQTVTTEDYKYYFNKFTLKLGAFLDLDVCGYGAWNPEFTFLNLDLSGMLGSLGLYVGDHVQCDWAFNCTPAPISQQTSMTSSLVDDLAPTTTLAVAPPNGSNQWYVTDVGGTLTATDNPTGCGIGVASTAYGLSDPPQTGGTSFTLGYEGIRTLYWRSTDKDGNVEGSNSRIVKIDKTPPTIDGWRTSDPNVRNWYNHDVVVHFVATDATSGVASLTGDTIVSAETTGQFVDGTAVDFAGLSSTKRVGDINIDKTAPAIDIRVPSADGYKNTDVITLDWSIADPLSGILSYGSTLDGLTKTVAKQVEITSGNTIELLELGGGQHTLEVTSTDNADNVRVNTVTFLIDVDIDGLIAAVNYTCQQGWMSQGACKSLWAKANRGKNAIAAGNTNGARGVLLAFNTELQALHGKGVKENAFRILYADVQYVLRRYGLIGNA